MAQAWYVVHTYSGYELKAKAALELRIDAMGVRERFGEVLVPVEHGVEMRNGQKRQITRKWYPGYILVQMDLDNETWHVVKDTPKVTGFVGGARNPPPVPEHEMRRITSHFLEEDESEESVKPLMTFERTEEVRVLAGAFANMTAVVEEVHVNRARLKVIVNIFGRPTPLELDFTEVEKLS